MKKEKKQKAARTKSVTIMPHTPLIYGGDAKILQMLLWKQGFGYWTLLHASSKPRGHCSRASSSFFFYFAYLHNYSAAF